jgi:hypothetical protein
MKSNGTVIKYNGTLTLVQSIYDYVHLALWTTLAAFVVFFLAFIAPRLPEAATRAEALRIQEIAQENEGYCAKWQMGLRTKMHDQCISDLQELRWKIQDRIADRLDFWLLWAAENPRAKWRRSVLSWITSPKRRMPYGFISRL